VNNQTGNFVYVVTKFTLSRMAENLKLIFYVGEGTVVLSFVKVIYFLQNSLLLTVTNYSRILSAGLHGNVSR